MPMPNSPVGLNIIESYNDNVLLASRGEMPYAESRRRRLVDDGVSNCLHDVKEDKS